MTVLYSPVKGAHTMADKPKNSYLVRVEGLVPRVDQIAVEAATPEEAEDKAVEIATDEGFTDAHAVTAVPVSHGVVVPKK